MSLNSIETQWIERYYYNGIGLIKPAKLPFDESVYKKAVQELLYLPVQQILSQAPTAETLQQVLKDIKQSFPKTPFHMLPTVAKNMAHRNGWQSDLTLACQKVLSHAKVAYCLVKNGVAFQTYVDSSTNEPLGVFPHKVGYIAELSDSTDTDVVAYLLSKNPMQLTDRECEIMRNIFRVDNNYNSRATKVYVEVFQGGKFEMIEMSPLGSLFPPYCVRELWGLLPETNPYSSKHEQAYMYAKEHSDEYPDALKYLAPYFEMERPTKLTSQTPDEDLANSQTTYDGVFRVIEQEEYTDKKEGESVFNGISELLQNMIDNNLVRGNWSIDQTIEYYENDDAEEPYAFDPNETSPSKESMRGAYETILKIMEVSKMTDDGVYVGEFLRALKLLSTGEAAKVEISNARFMAEQLLADGYDGNLTLNDIVNGKEKPATRKDIAAQWIADGADSQLSLSEIKDGHTSHKTYQIRTIPGLINSDCVDARLKDVLALIEHPIADLSSLIATPFLDDDFKLTLLTTETITNCDMLYPGLAGKIIGALRGIDAVSEPTLSDVLNKDLVPSDLEDALLTSEATGQPVQIPKQEPSMQDVLTYVTNHSLDDSFAHNVRHAVGLTENDITEYLKTHSISPNIIACVKANSDEPLTPTLSEESIYSYLQNKGADKGIANAAVSGIQPEAYIRSYLQQKQIAPKQIEALFSGESEDAVIQAALLAKGFDRDTAAEILQGHLPVGAHGLDSDKDIAEAYLKEVYTDEELLQYILSGKATTKEHIIDAPGYRCIRSLLDGIFADLVEFDKLPYDDMMKKRMTIVPLFRNFARAFGCDTKTTKPYEQFLTELREKCAPNVQEHIDHALNQLK